MDVVHDGLADGRHRRIVTLLEQWGRQRQIPELGSCKHETTRANAVDAASRTYGKPVSITCDHGTGFMSRMREDWACTRGVSLDDARPGTPTEHSDIESFNGTRRAECLHMTPFGDITHAQQVIAA